MRKQGWLLRPVFAATLVAALVVAAPVPAEPRVTFRIGIGSGPLFVNPNLCLGYGIPRPGVPGVLRFDCMGDPDYFPLPRPPAAPRRLVAEPPPGCTGARDHTGQYIFLCPERR